jgi:nucleotide-binding universal stress UspA family protein
MPGQPAAVPFRNILFATDFSAASNAAFAYATTISDRYQSRLYVAHVVSLEPFDLIAPEAAPSMIEKARDRARQKILELVGERRAQADGFHPLVGDGTVPDVLVEMMRRNHIDLAILGTHGRRAFKKLLLGSVAEEVFRVAPCPVLTIGPRTTAPNATIELRHILYPLEFVPDPSDAARYAISLADQYGASLTVMNIREAMPAAENRSEQLTQPAERWVDDHIPASSDLRHRVRLERGFGPAGAAILNFATKAAVDLIVMPVKRVDPVLAAHLPKPDTAYEVVSGASCPVLTVR